MSELSNSTSDIASVLHSSSALLANARNSFKALENTATRQTNDSRGNALDDTKAQEAANKFEALLLHNMLKSMRKTTLSENTSNAKAVYDDMLDEKLADTMMQSGGIGIADQIVAQIREQQGTNTSASTPGTDANSLRELSKHIQRPGDVGNSGEYVKESTSNAATNSNQLRLATSLWSDERPTNLSKIQYEFIQPLLPHVQRNAQKLGTSPAAILAIAALETGWGRAVIKDGDNKSSNNLFGIKATDSDNRAATTLTTEYIEGSPQKLEARFKTYPSKADSIDGFSEFILTNPRYSKALRHASNPEQFLQELQNAGYATDPRYAEKTISIMRTIAKETPPL